MKRKPRPTVVLCCTPIDERSISKGSVLMNVSTGELIRVTKAAQGVPDRRFKSGWRVPPTLTVIRA